MSVTASTDEGSSWLVVLPCEVVAEDDKPMTDNGLNVVGDGKLMSTVADGVDYTMVVVDDEDGRSPVAVDVGGDVVHVADY